VADVNDEQTVALIAAILLSGELVEKGDQQKALADAILLLNRSYAVVSLDDVAKHRKKRE